MSDDEKTKLRLGGMALRNGLALFGPTSWAAAVRMPDGGIRVESGRRPRVRFADRVPFMRGVVRMSEMLAALPVVRRRLPEARLSFENGSVAASTLFCAALATVVKRRGGFRSEVAATVIGIVPSFVTLRNRELVRYHGAEHKTVAGYEGDVAAAGTAKEHERCGTHLVAPMLLAGIGAAGIASKAPESIRRPVGALGSLAAVGFAFELFAWRERNPDSLGARALGTPGTALQKALATAEPGAAELEVADRALAALLAAEGVGARVSTLPGLRRRLPSEVFDLPVEKMREGYYSDVYFVFTKQVLELDGYHPRVLMQVFQRHQSVLGGMDEAIAVLRECSGRIADDGTWVPGWDDLVVHALHDGDEIEPWETVMTIEGDYSLFCHLETVYLGTLARRTLIARNVREVVRAARGKPILYFPARHDHHRVQTGDGYAAHIAGAIGVSTDAQASWWGGRGMGTVPHGLIAAYGGDTVLASRRFVETLGAEMDVIVLVDFENDCVTTAVAVARALGPQLWGVRLDTSSTMVDRSLAPQMGRFDPRGVNPQLVRNVREALDREGFPGVRIVASGGFNVARIASFEEAAVPVDAYGVGSALIRGENDFTADVVVRDGRPAAKAGRGYLPNPRLEHVV